MATVNELISGFRQVLLLLESVPPVFRHVVVRPAPDDSVAPMARISGGTSTTEKVDPNIGVDAQQRLFTFAWPLTSFEKIEDRWKEAVQIVGKNFGAKDGPFDIRDGFPGVKNYIAVIKQMIGALEAQQAAGLLPRPQPAQPDKGIPMWVWILGGLAGAALLAWGAAHYAKKHQEQQQLPASSGAPRKPRKPRKKKKTTQPVLDVTASTVEA